MTVSSELAVVAVFLSNIPLMAKTWRPLAQEHLYAVTVLRPCTAQQQKDCVLGRLKGHLLLPDAQDVAILWEESAGCSVPSLLPCWQDEASLFSSVLSLELQFVPCFFMCLHGRRGEGPYWELPASFLVSRNGEALAGSVYFNNSASDCFGSWHHIVPFPKSGLCTSAFPVVSVTVGTTVSGST